MKKMVLAALCVATILIGCKKKDQPKTTAVWTSYAGVTPYPGRTLLLDTLQMGLYQASATGIEATKIYDRTGPYISISSLISGPYPVSLQAWYLPNSVDSFVQVSVADLNTASSIWEMDWYYGGTATFAVKNVTVVTPGSVWVIGGDTCRYYKSMQSSIQSSSHAYNVGWKMGNYNGGRFFWLAVK